ncbi:hypothetical protein BGW41_001086 [Actinomortierella wolfii]|nr:hypothetical protein BGW41_001086 [Actinomortierella wolfii]
MQHPISINTLLSIPEFQYRLVSFLIDYILRTENLKSCQLVSRAWREIFTPHLWKVCSLDAYAARDLCHAVDGKAALQRIGRHVRHVRIADVDTFAAILPCCPNITTLDINDFNWMKMVSSMESCMNLETLTIACYPGNTTSLAELVPGLSHTLARRLRHLSITANIGIECTTSDLIDLLIGLPLLESINIAASEFWRINHDPTLLKQHQFNLRSIELHDYNYEIINNHSFNFALWRQCTNLEKYDISTLHMSSEQIPAAMSEFASLFDQRDDYDQPVRRAKTLILPARFVTQGVLLARILQGCVKNHLTRLDMGRCVIGHQTLKVLLDVQLECLEQLAVEGRVPRGIDPSPWIQRLLCTCPRLRELVMQAFVPDIGQTLRLNAEDIISSPWVCSRLSVLHVPIVGVPTNMNDDHAVYTIDQVMRQIGKMVHLQSLGTGFLNDLSSMVLRDTLPFSLGVGGLQHLASLKQLETLNVKRCAHAIRYAEAKWMDANWPKLREISGLDRLWENSTTHPAQWLRSRGVDVPLS